MTEAFDALHKWLGIPPAQQPPNAYQLLGIQSFESDLDVISNAADQRMAHLRTFAQGPNAVFADNLLNQVAAARLCLLNPQRKKTYDEALRSRSGRPVVGSEQSVPPPAGDGGSQGALFGAYVVCERIGGGRSGPIFRAKNRKTGRDVSLKILPPSLAGSSELLKRFERETKITSSLRHPNLVEAFGAGQQDGVHFLVLEHLDGIDLATLIQRQGPLPAARATNYVIQVAKGLAYLHAHGVVHRNIKPHNLMLAQTGVVKIANLTVAHLTETGDERADGQEELTKQGDMLGSVDYLAPEQASDARSVDGRADIYSLGCTLHYLLTGRPPYSGKSMMDKLVAHRSQPIPTLAGQLGDVSPQLDRVMGKMLGKQPVDRFASMEEVVNALEGRDAGVGTLTSDEAPSISALPQVFDEPRMGGQASRKASSKRTSFAWQKLAIILCSSLVLGFLFFAFSKNSNDASVGENGRTEKPNVPRLDAPKAIAPDNGTPKVEPPNDDARKPEVLKANPLKEAVGNPDAPMADVLKADPTKTDAARPDVTPDLSIKPDPPVPDDEKYAKERATIVAPDVPKGNPVPPEKDQERATDEPSGQGKSKTDKRSGGTAGAKRSVIVTKALYGVPGKEADLTSYIQRAIAKDPFMPVGSDSNSFGDPASGQNKKLVIEYRIAGQSLNFETPDNVPAIFPPVPAEGTPLPTAKKKFFIVAARYGFGMTWVDVTPNVRRRITDPSTALLWSNFGASVPQSGYDKYLAIWFDDHGIRYARIWKDGETHSLLP